MLHFAHHVMLIRFQLQSYRILDPIKRKCSATSILALKAALRFGNKLNIYIGFARLRSWFNWICIYLFVWSNWTELNVIRWYPSIARKNPNSEWNWKSKSTLLIFGLFLCINFNVSCVSDLHFAFPCELHILMLRTESLCKMHLFHLWLFSQLSSQMNACIHAIPSRNQFKRSHRH